MEPVDSTQHVKTDWLKQQPQQKRSSTFASHSPYSVNTTSNNPVSSLTMHERNMISSNTNKPWTSIAATEVHQRSLAPSPTLSVSSIISSSSGPSLSLPIKTSSIGLNGQFLPPLDLEPLMIHPQDDEDEEDDATHNDPSSSLIRIRELEDQLARAQDEARTYKEQLAHQNQTAQRMLEASLVETEKQTIEIRQLVDVVNKQERLIHLLHEKTSTSSSSTFCSAAAAAAASTSSSATTASQLSSSPPPPPPHDEEYTYMRCQIVQMRKELDTLNSEKRSLEARMASFLEEELDDMTMSHEDLSTFGYRHQRHNSEQQNQEILQHLEMRRRSSSVLDADQYSLMAFGGTSPPNHHIQVSATNSSGLLPPLNQVREEEDETDDDDDDEDAVSRYSSFASSPMTTTTSFHSPSMASSNNYFMKQSSSSSSTGVRESIASLSSPTTAAANNAARKAAWARVMLPVTGVMPPATPPPSHPLPPVPPNIMDGDDDDDDNASDHGSNIPEAPASKDNDDDTNQDNRQQEEYVPPSPATTRSFSPVSSNRMSMHPLVISTSISTSSHSHTASAAAAAKKHTSADAITRQTRAVRSISPPPPSAPPTVSPQSSSLLAALNKNHSVDANLGRPIATGASSSDRASVPAVTERGSFWRGMKKKWKK
ncbi:hypothetical protein BDB00DRAFT_34401 [Zychaea mexicana]|uniref:uncharacterized protein n=1 Tax=Zychaea mexicana TaxID=64656 RepID=UPI0022FE160F|nr:uncharacterized protein BDB00DRAFT_34401 [Zychaea mexicana]KAI9488651.1 hypothetical protein BDB00DRAFT_34401 [Zychaea mexicana]